MPEKFLRNTFCTQCVLQFGTISNYDLHVKLVHQEENTTENIILSENASEQSKSVGCEICDIEFASKSGLREKSHADVTYVIKIMQQTKV